MANNEPAERDHALHCRQTSHGGTAAAGDAKAKGSRRRKAKGGVTERWLKTAVAQCDHFVQILAILPFDINGFIKGAESLVFPRILDGRLRRTGDASILNGGKKWAELQTKGRF